MIRFLAVLIFALSPLSALAQSVASIDEPIRPNRAPLAASAEVPAVLLLGLGGPTAALVNPARAARDLDRFAYGTFRPNQGPLSFASLVGTRDRRWLLVADNSIAVREDSDTRSRLESTTLPSGGTTVSESEEISANTSVNTATRARLLHVGRTDFGGYAFGLYGGYRSRRFESERTTNAMRVQNTPEPPYTESREQVSDQLQIDDQDDFAVGAELALAGRTWDLAASVAYQHRAADAAWERRSALDRSFENELQSLDEERLEAFSHTVEATPRAIDFEVIGALRAGRHRDDYLYGSVSGTYGNGTADYVSSTESRLLLVREVEGEIVEDIDTSTESDDEGDVDLTTSATQASLGYVYAHRGRRLTILAAVNPTASFERIERVTPEPVPNAAPVSKSVTDLTALALHLPLYLRFDVTRSLKAFGGGVYTYGYDRIESSDRPVVSSEGDRESERARTTDFVQSNGRLFAGAVLTFRSGLTAQAAFHGDLAALDGWTVSLGYRF